VLHDPREQIQVSERFVLSRSPKEHGHVVIVARVSTRKRLVGRPVVLGMKYGHLLPKGPLREYGNNRDFGSFHQVWEFLRQE
jgi:hypothetical protein